MNPLASSRAAPSTANHPAMMHARMWRHINGMAPNSLVQKMDQTSFITPILGGLAADPSVTRKDVIKAASDAAGSGKVPADQAVQFITQMPTDPDKLQPWLKGLYAANLSAQVHLKAATMGAPQMPQNQQPMPQMGAPQMPQPGAPA